MAYRITIMLHVRGCLAARESPVGAAATHVPPRRTRYGEHWPQGPVTEGRGCLTLSYTRPIHWFDWALWGAVDCPARGPSRAERTMWGLYDGVKQPARGPRRRALRPRTPVQTMWDGKGNTRHAQPRPGMDRAVGRRGRQAVSLRLRGFLAGPGFLGPAPPAAGARQHVLFEPAAGAHTAVRTTAFRGTSTAC